MPYDFVLNFNKSKLISLSLYLRINYISPKIKAVR